MTTLDEYQKQAMRTANRDCIVLSNAALGMCGESGKFADDVKRSLHQGHPVDVMKLARKAGDVLWYVALACEALGLSLEEIAQANIAKLRARYPDGYSNEASMGHGHSQPPLALYPVAPIGKRAEHGFGQCSDGSAIYEWEVDEYPPCPRGDQLRDLRVQLGIGVRMAAAVWGVQATDVYRIEAGRVECDWDLAEHMLRKSVP